MYMTHMNVTGTIATELTQFMSFLVRTETVHIFIAGTEKEALPYRDPTTNPRMPLPCNMHCYGVNQIVGPNEFDFLVSRPPSMIKHWKVHVEGFVVQMLRCF